MNSDNELSNKNSNKSENIDFRIYAIEAQKELEAGRISSAEELFNKSHSILGIAYCKFLKGEIEEANVLLKMIDNSSPAVNWLLSLISIIKGEYKNPPTYMQIKSFYEQDLNMLFFYGQTKIARDIIKKSKYIENYNREVYKFISRVLMNAGEIEEAVKYIQKSFDVFYNDPETHFIYGELLINMNKKEKAKREFKISDKIAGGYQPAIKKLKELS